MVNRLTNKVRREVYQRDGYVCALCGNHGPLQIHHVIRRGQGGSDSPRNLITLCDKCHAAAHGFDVYPGIVSAEDVELAIIQYMADYYTDEESNWVPD